jgi:hypothetical protein
MILLITYILNLFDLFMTNHWVSLYGISIEGNPLGRWMFENGVAWVFKIFVVGGLLALLGVCIRIKPKLAPVAIIPLVVYGLIVLYHIAILIYIN